MAKKQPRYIHHCNVNRECRVWRIIVWPDSAPSDWRMLLDSLNIPWAESPLHTADPDSVLEDERKPHIHVALFFEGKKSFDQICDITQQINAPYPLPCDCPRGFIRYMCHLDHPDKPQYPISSVIPHNGAEIEQYFNYSQDAYRRLSKDLFRFIDDQKIFEYGTLIRVLIAYDLDEFYDMATKVMTIAVKSYIASIRGIRKLERENNDV